MVLNQNVLAHHAAIAQGRGLRVVLVRRGRKASLTGTVIRTTISAELNAHNTALRKAKKPTGSNLLLWLDTQDDPVPLNDVVELKRATE